MKNIRGSKKIYLSPPHISGNERKYVEEVFDSNWVAPAGPFIERFEQALAETCGVKHVAAVSSGTAAIHLALLILGVGPGDEVIASTFTFSATVNPIIYQGATPILIDSEPRTWNMDPELLEKAIKDRLKKGKKPKAIIPVHLYGMPADMDEIMRIASHYEIPVIEDAAEALGSKYKGQPLGSFGEIGILSFNGNKIITTSGGGALLSNNPEYVEKARFYSTQARDKAVHYQHSHIGYNYRMSNVLAAIGLGQMENLEQRVQKRREIFETYKKELGHLPGISFPENSGPEYYSNRWLSCMLVDPEKAGVTHLDIMEHLAQHNIESRPLWKPMHMQPVFEKYLIYDAGVSEQLFNKGICLPSGSSLNKNDLASILMDFKICF
jgi:dTDP-4-amino-4,6-dideoxygalactose transaminase